MSAPAEVIGVDVLAVIDQDRARLARAYGEAMAEHDGYLADHDVMRAAVAELIEATDCLTDAMANDRGYLGDILKGIRLLERDSFVSALSRVRVALARVEGLSHG
jgi:hypothetical protein